MSNDAAAHHPRRRSVTRAVIIAGSLVLIAVAFVAVWVTIRGMTARDELAAAVPLVHRIETSAIAGDASHVDSELRLLGQHTARAVALTSDPVWTLAEVVPWLGSNLTAIRTSASVADRISTEVVPPMVSLLTTTTVDELLPKNGTIDVASIAAAQRPLKEARAAMTTAALTAATIDERSLLPAIAKPIGRFLTLVDRTSDTIDGLDTAVRVLPSMLGAHGARSYLLLSLTNSELRTSGGIPGALAVISADTGSLTLGATASIDDLKRFAEPVIPLSSSELTLFGTRLGKWMENAVSTPDFTRSGALAQAIWQERRGQEVDGVISIDPVALGYILAATGPIDAGSGVTLNSANAAPFLLSTVYAQFPDTRDQDAFFSEVTKKIFAAITSGTVDSRKLISGLGRSVSEGRIRVWSSHENEQKSIAGSDLAGALPASTNTSSGFGVYLNDATGGKMDYYLRASVAAATARCRADSRPYVNIDVTLASIAPLDAATSLPSYVTGRYAFGVEPGKTRTNVYVSAPPGSDPYSVLINGKEYAFVTAPLDGRPMVGAVVEIAPQKSTTLTFRFLARPHAPTKVTVATTPMSSPVEVALGGSLRCANGKL